MSKGNDILARLADPSLKWYVYPAFDGRIRVYGDITDTNQTLYLCDDALCFPVRFSGYLSWFDPSTNNVGSRVFDKDEAWDHTSETTANTSPPYNGIVVWIPGYRGYWVAIPLTDGTNKVQVNLIHRYTDGAILIFNTGKDGANTVNITVRVYDPPSALGYSVSTNGTRGTGYTDIAPGQYVLFYKGTAPSVDVTNGVFATSPFGSNKSLSNELYVSTMTQIGHIYEGVYNINVPKMYLGVKANSDMEIISNYRFLRIYNNAWIGSLVGSNGLFRNAVNVGSYFWFSNHVFHAYDTDPPTTTNRHTWVVFKLWSGWAEDDSGNVKFIVYSEYVVKHHTKWVRRLAEYCARIYDVDRDEEYLVAIVKPITNIYCYGANGNVETPVFVINAPDIVSSLAVGYMTSTDTFNKITSPATTCYEYTNNVYAYCVYYSDKIVCHEAVAIYTNDSSLMPSDPKAWGIARCSTAVDKMGVSSGLRAIAWQDKTWTAGKIYAVVGRAKEFPSNTSDTDLQTWIMSISPKILSDTEFNSIFSILPMSLYLFGENKDTVSITAPSSVNPSQSFNVTVSCPARAGKSVWVALVDSNGNVVASASGTLDSLGNATLTLVTPTSTGTYRIIAIVAGDRTLP